MTHAIQGVPHARPSLSHHDVPSPFYGMFATRHLAQGLLLRTQLIQESRRDGHIPFQGVHHQLTDGIDLIGIGVLQSFPSHVLVGFAQHAPQKRKLSSKASHHDVLLSPHGPVGLYRVTGPLTLVTDGPYQRPRGGRARFLSAAMALEPAMARGKRKSNISPPRCQIRLGGHLCVETIPPRCRRRRRPLRPRRTMIDVMG